jgi:hypothetical protein
VGCNLRETVVYIIKSHLDQGGVFQPVQAYLRIWLLLWRSSGEACIRISVHNTGLLRKEDSQVPQIVPRGPYRDGRASAF